MAAWHFGTNTALFASGTSEQRTLTQVIRDSDGLYGGFVEFATNLSQLGTAFVYGSGSYVLGTSTVAGTSSISNNACVIDSAVQDCFVDESTLLIASSLYNSVIKGNTYVTSCSINNAYVTGSNTITNSSIDSSTLNGNQLSLSDSTIISCNLLGQMYVMRNSTLDDVLITGTSSSGSQYAISYGSRGQPYNNNYSVPMIINSSLSHVSVSSGMYVDQ